MIIINESIISPMWYFSTSVRPPLAALFPVSVALHLLWLRRNFLYGTVRPCIFILTQKHKFTSHNETKNMKKLDTKTFMTYLKKLAGRFCSVSPNNFISYVYLFLQDKQNQMRLIRSKFSIRNGFIQTYSDLFLFSQVSYERNITSQQKFQY